MIVWQILAVVGICFLILEMFTPSMFFLNFALSAFITAGLSYWIKNPYTLGIVFFAFSFISFIFLRPVIMKKFSKFKETGLQSKYVGQVAKVEDDVCDNSGVITIYGERWDARSEDGSLIEKGSEVKIIRNESIIMYVEKI